MASESVDRLRNRLATRTPDWVTGSLSTRLRGCGSAGMAGPVLVAAAAALPVWAVRFRSPYRFGAWGVCPWFVLTGGPCPTCGGLRALSDLGRLDLVAAFAQNAYLTVTAIGLALGWVVWFVASVRTARTVRSNGRCGSRSRNWFQDRSRDQSRWRRHSCVLCAESAAAPGPEVGLNPQPARLRAMAGPATLAGEQFDRVVVTLVLVWVLGLIGFGLLRATPGFEWLGPVGPVWGPLR